MPKPPDLPSPERVRILSASKDLKPADADKHGDQFFDAGLYSQAMVFYERSKTPDRFAKVKERAVQEGDAFLLLWITRLSPELVTEDEWARAGENALAVGKIAFARDCFEKANQPERAQEMRQKYLEIFKEPAKP